MVAEVYGPTGHRGLAPPPSSAHLAAATIVHCLVALLVAAAWPHSSVVPNSPFCDYPCAATRAPFDVYCVSAFHCERLVLLVRCLRGLFAGIRKTFICDQWWSLFHFASY